MNRPTPAITFAPQPPPAAGAAALAEVQGMVRACMQCGTCTGSCPNAHAMDLTPRRMWRMLLFGQVHEVLASRSFWLCSACYACTLRCPRGLPLTQAMAALKRLAAAEPDPTAHKKALFYSEFMHNVERRGRVRETELMLHYFMGMHDALLPLKYTPLGLKLLRRGKLHLGAAPGEGHLTDLRPLFEKVRSMEARS